MADSASTIGSSTCSQAVDSVSTTTTTKADCQIQQPITLLLENPRKSTNWGPLLRCCAAFGISQIFVIGYDQCSVQGSHGASKHVELVAFSNHETAIQTLKDELGFVIVGLLQGHGMCGGGSQNEDEDENGLPVHVYKPNSSPSKQHHGYADDEYGHDGENDDNDKEEEHDDDDDSSKIVVVGTHRSVSPLSTTTSHWELHSKRSYPSHARKFSSKTCLAVGKASRGLVYSLARYCESFIHIPHQGLLSTHYDDGGDNHHHPPPLSILTMEACLSIVLHEFALWARRFHNQYPPVLTHPNHNDNNNNNNDNSQAGGVNIQGQKYQVQPKTKGYFVVSSSTSSSPSHPEQQIRRIQQQRIARRQQASQDDEDNNNNNNNIMAMFPIHDMEEDPADY